MIVMFQDLVNGFTCSCAVGWNGDTCGDDIDECAEVSACKDDDKNCTVSFSIASWNLQTRDTLVLIVYM